MKKCKFCGSKTKEIRVKNYLNINLQARFQKCSECKVYINNKISKNIYTASKKNLNSYLNKNILYYLKSFFLYFSYLKVKKYFPKKKNIILDFGSGSGEFPFIMTNTNDKIFATDFEYNKSLYIKKISFIKVNELFAKNYYKKFDVIFLRHVLEHILDFDTIIIMLKKKLKNEGKLIIEIPNYKSFWKLILRGNWPGFFYPFHHYVFSESFLIKKFKSHNLKIIKISYVEPPIFGSFFSSLGIERSLSKFLSVIVYPFQYILSKLTFSSEGLQFILKK